MTPKQLNIAFPLFDADISEASEYAGKKECSVCGQHSHAFELDIGCALMIDCPRCENQAGLDASYRNDGKCHSCGSVIPFPEIEDDRSIYICYQCLRDGKGAITSDTELGMVSWEQAFEGLTHGMPGIIETDFELVEDDGWFRAKVDQKHLIELLRTPNYSTIQGEQWKFCCLSPMVYFGRWDQSRFEAEAQGKPGRELFDKIVQGVVEGLWEDQLHDITGVYVFRCEHCGRLAAHWDIA
jgi:uncharacterized protein CbrC (UPF0167 family)